MHALDVRALVGGAFFTVPVAVGDRGETGGALARIDAAAQQAMVRQAVAGLDAALVAEARAWDTLARTEALRSNVTRTALDTATRAVQSAEQDVARATALVDQARAQVRLAAFAAQTAIDGDKNFARLHQPEAVRSPD